MRVLYCASIGFNGALVAAVLLEAREIPALFSLAALMTMAIIVAVAPR